MSFAKFQKSLLKPQAQFLSCLLLFHFKVQNKEKEKEIEKKERFVFFFKKSADFGRLMDEKKYCVQGGDLAPEGSTSPLNRVR